jgi:enoyl-CoA hydratase
MSGPAPRALQKWVDMQRAGKSDSVFLTAPEPWIRGEAVDLNAPADA